ncbi:MAG TPA: acyl carrier protein, partial [Herpetosiphonaceae bacterium]
TLLRQDAAQVGAVAIDWPEWFDAYPHTQENPFFAQMLAAQADDAVAGQDSPLVARFSRSTLLMLPEPEQLPALNSYVREQIARVLRLPLAMLDPEQPINSLGLDSMMAVELKNRIESDLGSAPSIVTFLQGASISDVTKQLLERVAVEQEAAPVPIVAAQDEQLVALATDDDTLALLANLDHLSDTDIDLLLDKML